jgi:REP element-mobilizing transposase RayT
MTFRLFGSLPPGREFTSESVAGGKAFLCMDRLLDGARSGPTHLVMPSIAQIVVASLQHCDQVDYGLHAWVLMPNHVHMLATPRTDVSKFMRRLKGYTARRSNELLHRTGEAFWQEESYDRLVRTPEEFKNIESYILNNPVKAGLATSVEEYRWSSAHKGKAGL